MRPRRTTHPGWGKDYADPRVGVKGTVTGVPSFDAELDRCGALVGGPRVSCYAVARPDRWRALKPAQSSAA